MSAFAQWGHTTPRAAQRWATLRRMHRGKNNPPKRHDLLSHFHRPANQRAGQNANDIAVRILQGEAPSQMTMSSVELGVPKFDWREMQRCGLAPVSWRVVGLGSGYLVLGWRKRPSWAGSGRLCAHAGRNAQGLARLPSRRRRCAYLSRRFVAVNFEFRSTTLAGVAEQRERWKRTVGSINFAWGRRSGGSMWRAIFRQRPRRRSTISWRTCGLRSRSASRGLTG